MACLVKPCDMANDLGLPVLVWLASVLGVHPVISATPLLAYFAPALTAFDAIFVMQAHMIGGRQEP